MTGTSRPGSDSRHLSRRVALLFSGLLTRAKMAEHTFMVVLAVMIGGLGGLGAVAFRFLIKVVQRAAWGSWTYNLTLVTSRPWPWRWLAPALGGLLVGALVHFMAREAKGHGVPEVMEAVALRSGFIRARLVTVKSLASAICIGTGGSVGREGPIVQIGAALGSTIGQWLRISGARLRTLAGCGAAAGIAATFNAPVAGALFAVEVILGDFGVSQFSPIVISSVMATVVSRHFLGDFPAFEVPTYLMESAWELPLYMLLGLLAAIAAQVFIRVLYGIEDLMEALPVKPWLLPAIGGLAVGAIGLIFPQVLGVGYETINHALNGELTLGLLIVLLVAKLLATSVTLGSGGSGGIFAPSLFLGAMSGGFLGNVAHHLYPGATATSGAYALVGMGAVVAGTTHAPITAILIIFELTSDYKLIIPLMASCIIASLVSTRLKRESIYTMKLYRRGADLFRGREVNVLRSLHVQDVMDDKLATLTAETPLTELVEQLADSPHSYYYTTDSAGDLNGVISLAELRHALLDPDTFSEVAVVGNLARTDVPSVTPDQDLDTVMRIFGGKDREELPVVEAVDSNRLVGVVNRRHLIDAYGRELMKKDMVTSLTSGVAATATEEVVLDSGHLIAEIEAPGEFIGKTIGELDVRNRYRVQILLIRRAPAHSGPVDQIEVVPGPGEPVRRGDRLVIMGERSQVHRLQRL
jgi:CIC family chloride channel protein